MDVVSRHPEMPVSSHLTQFGDLTLDLISNIASRLSLKDFVFFKHACSSIMKESTICQIFRKDPFFLRETFGEINRCWFYSVTMRKWILLEIPIQVYPPQWRPINESGGLILYHGVGLSQEDCLLFMRRWWPLMLINSLSRKVRHLAVRLEFPPEVDIFTFHRRCFYHVQMAMKVNSDSSYKVVVHWKHSLVVQIFSSVLNVWSTLTVPRELEAYVDCSDDVVFCHSSF